MSPAFTTKGLARLMVTIDWVSVAGMLPIA